MWFAIGIVVFLLYVGYLAYELSIAPTIKDDPIKHESDKWHDECVEARKKST